MAALALAEGDDGTTSSVAAVNGVVVHGVDTKFLAARIREADQRVVDGEPEAAAKALASLTTDDLSPLLEEGEGVWLNAQESVLQRVARLPPAGLDAYRKALDPRAETALADAIARRDSAALTRDATRFAFTTHGTKLLLLLADQRIAQGDLGSAARALEDMLRLLPSHAPAGALAAAASRLAGLLAVQGDAPGVRAIAADLPPAVLAAPSPLAPGTTLADELTGAAALASRRADAATAPGPSKALHVAAENQLPGPLGARSESGVGPDGRVPGSLAEHPLAIGGPDRPVLLTRVHSRDRTVSRVVALTPADEAARPPGAPRRIPPFRTLWAWPASAAEEARPAVTYPFAPARLDDDLVVFTWPAPVGAPVRPSRGRDRFSDPDEERHELVVLSIAAQGKLVEERGFAEAPSDRDDGDPELATLSFCGKPCVDGRSVYVTGVRHSDEGHGDPTELHVLRFDRVPDGRRGVLRLRWRRHVLDGHSIPSAVLPANAQFDLTQGVVLPSAPLVRAGRVFVASNTGAVACLDAASGRPEWVETYDRFGPSPRTVVRETSLGTWDDVPLSADGPYLFAAPRDSESLIQFRRAPRGERAMRIDDFKLSAPNGTSRQASRLLSDMVATDVAAVRDGVAYVAGHVVLRPLVPSGVPSSPFAALRLDTRSWMLGQIQEYTASGTPVLVRGALLFPSPKAIYRVPLGDFEAAPIKLWEYGEGGDPMRGQDRIGNLVPDGERLWTVTPTRIVLLEPIAK